MWGEAVPTAWGGCDVCVKPAAQSMAQRLCSVSRSYRPLQVFWFQVEWLFQVRVSSIKYPSASRYAKLGRDNSWKDSNVRISLSSLQPSSSQLLRDFAPQGIFSSIWRQFWLSRLRREELLAANGWRPESSYKKCIGQPLRAIMGPQMLIVLSLRLGLTF